MKRCNGCGLFNPNDASACARCESSTFRDEGAPVLVDGRYALEDPLGQGGMGVVYRARDVWLDRPVALKLVAPSIVGSSDAAARFRREAATLASVRSEHVVQVYAFGPYEDSFFLALEYVRGKDLDAVLAERFTCGANVPIGRVIDVLSQVAKGLGAVHRAGLVHLDIKPGNIVIEDDTGRPVLVDFGLARWSAHGSQRMQIEGSPAYMAPERVATNIDPASLTHQTDIYSLGCVLFECLTGEPPFTSETLDQMLALHLVAPIPKVSTLRPELAMFDDIVARALAKEPSDRFPSCEAFCSALADAVPELTLPDVEGALDEGPAAAENGVSVLIVDDDPDFCTLAAKAVQIALPDTQTNIATAGTGEEALQKAAARPPKLLLLDFGLPRLDGVATLSKLRAMPRGHLMRVVVVSGHVSASAAWQFSALGVREFISKPVDLRALAEGVRRVAERSEWLEGGDGSATPAASAPASADAGAISIRERSARFVTTLPAEAPSLLPISTRPDLVLETVAEARAAGVRRWVTGGAIAILAVAFVAMITRHPENQTAGAPSAIPSFEADRVHAPLPAPSPAPPLPRGVDASVSADDAAPHATVVKAETPPLPPPRPPSPTGAEAPPPPPKTKPARPPPPAATQSPDYNPLDHL